MNKLVIGAADRRLRNGVAILEGSMPVSVLVPSLHRFLHYGKQTKKFGRLESIAMWGFERFNHRFKTCYIRNNSRPMTSAGLFLSVFVIVSVSDCHWFGVVHTYVFLCLCDV